MDIVTIDNNKFIRVELDNAVAVFSTAENNLDFNIASKEGMENLQKIKTWFDVNEVGFLKQIHSDYVFDYDKEFHEGDGLVTDKFNTAIGIFNADCVPIMIYDTKNKVIAAVHSGWKGTQYKIVQKAIDKMEKQYGSRGEDLRVCIGPHNRACCYEVGEEVAELFVKDELYRDLSIYINGKLDLEACIIKQLQAKGVTMKNINSLNICTYCNTSVKLHSYRKNRNSYGRMFSFIYMKE